jgi:NTP pyrophosphatase (non-canonical NTP hydrolase)
MTPSQYQILALRTENTPEFIDAGSDRAGDVASAQRLARVIHAAMGMCTETAELQDMLKKHIMYGKPFDAVNVMEECSDTLWYIALALDACGYTMEAAMERNIAKLKARYGDKFNQAGALSRDLETERTVLEGGTK